MTVVPPEALPITFGWLSFAGDAGDVDVNVGAGGGVESSVYEAKVVEHADSFPAASVAVAYSVVVASLGTVTETPPDANDAADPLPNAVPPHADPEYTFTVDPAAADPVTLGLLLFDGDGDTPLTVGAAGGVESSVYETELVEHADVTLNDSSVVVAWKVVVESSATAAAMRKVPPGPVATGVPVHPLLV